jgi:hypothetical protein
MMLKCQFYLFGKACALDCLVFCSRHSILNCVLRKGLRVSRERRGIVAMIRSRTSTITHICRPLNLPPIDRFPTLDTCECDLVPYGQDQSYASQSRGPCTATLTRSRDRHSVFHAHNNHVHKKRYGQSTACRGQLSHLGCRVHVFVLMLPSCRVSHWPE